MQKLHNHWLSRTLRARDNGAADYHPRGCLARSAAQPRGSSRLQAKKPAAFSPFAAYPVPRYAPDAQDRGTSAMRDFLRDCRQHVTWTNAIGAAKTIAVICAFLAFALSMRQKEFDRFSTVKPLFEIVQSTDAREFRLVNHGGIVYFSGCAKEDAGSLLRQTPRRYSTLSNAPLKFTFSQDVSNESKTKCYWRDADLNAYQLRIKYMNNGFYIDGVPIAYRSKVFVSLSNKWLDAFVTFIFPKQWFTPGEVPEDKYLVVIWPTSP